MDVSQMDEAFPKAKRSGRIKRPTRPTEQTLPIGWWLLSFAVLFYLH
jgi:hypothetical protein